MANDNYSWAPTAGDEALVVDQGVVTDATVVSMIDKRLGQAAIKAAASSAVLAEAWNPWFDLALAAGTAGGLALTYITLPGQELPRDPNSPHDMALTIPPNWAQHPADNATYWDAYQSRDGSTGIHYGSGGNTWTLSQWQTEVDAGLTLTPEEWVANQASPVILAAGFDALGHPGWTRYASTEWVEQIAPGDPVTFTNPAPTTAPQVVPVPESEPLPEESTPYRFLPYQPRSPYDDVGYSVAPGGEPDVNGQAQPVPPPTINLGPGPAPDAQNWPGLREPPPEGTKERKASIRYGNLAGALRYVGGHVLEAGDWLNAVWNWGLPPEFKTGYVKGWDGKWHRAYRSNQRQRIADVYRAWHKAPLEPILLALLRVNVQDSIHGIPGRVNRSVVRKAAADGTYWDPVGIQAGPWDRPYTGVDPRNLGNTSHPVELKTEFGWLDQGIRYIGGNDASNASVDNIINKVFR